MTVAAATLALALVAGAPPADVASLVAQLKHCKSLETCEPALELTKRGDAIWPDLAVGLEAPDEMTRFWTLGVLTNVPIVDAREAIAVMLDDKEIRVRAAAAFALGEQRDKAVTTWLLKALGDDNLNVRFSAAVALGKVKDPASVPALIGACRDKDEDVRAYAAQALGDIGDKRATPALVERVDQDIVGHVRGFAAMALGRLGDRTAVAPLLAALGREKDVKAMAAILVGLGELRDPAALPALKPLLKHAEETIQEHARYAIALIEAAAKKKAPQPDEGDGK